MMNKFKLGKQGEKIAEKYLRGQGIEIINRNYFTTFGEIDLIGKKKDTIIFFEVKLRNNNNFGAPEESVSSVKMKRLLKSAEIYLFKSGFNNFKCRFDFLFIYYSGMGYKVNWLKNQIFY